MTWTTRWPWCRTSTRSEEHTSELQSRLHLVCRLLLEKKKKYASSATFSDISTAIRHCLQCLPCPAARQSARTMNCCAQLYAAALFHYSLPSHSLTQRC